MMQQRPAANYEEIYHSVGSYLKLLMLLFSGYSVSNAMRALSQPRAVCLGPLSMV